ncbi:MAG: threonylcarbamoyl-AMP synthase [Candidatus Peribacteraceae bacterium]|nr:threonylcarbamoyl-AMP synthase [Candidatus Peribacteraceae bacterium]
MNILPAADGIELALKILHDGGVIAHATETCYGFACDLKNPDAVKKLFAIKHRPLYQPVSALFSSLDEAKKYVVWNDEAQKLADEYLPGPLTIILPLLSKTPTILFAIPPEQPINQLTNKQSMGIRISSFSLAAQLVREFGSPLSTTSANLHGQPNPYSAEDIVEQFKDQKFQPDLILDSGKLPPTPPSTVIDFTSAKDAKTLRKGDIPIA